MFSFFNKKEKKPQSAEIPEWAAFFTQEEYRAFLSAVENYFMGMQATYLLEEGIIEVDPEKYRFSQLGLSNVAQVCKQDSPENYSNIIHTHFATILKALEFDKAFDENTGDFDKVRPYLAVRLYGEEYITYVGGLEEDGESSVHRFVADDVYAMLVFDLPDAIRNVHPSHVLDWGIDEAALFETGIANIRKNYPMQITREDMGGFDIWFVNNDHFFTANILYELQDRPELTGSYGALVAVPHRHSALIYPIEDLGVLDAVRKMIPAAHAMYQEGPGSLTPNLFWYHNDIFTRLPYEAREEKLHLIPPENFLDLLNRLENLRH